MNNNEQQCPGCKNCDDPRHVNIPTDEQLAQQYPYWAKRRDYLRDKATGWPEAQEPPPDPVNVRRDSVYLVCMIAGIMLIWLGMRSGAFEMMWTGAGR